MSTVAVRTGSVDLNDFRLDDERSSATKRLVATTNTDQLSRTLVI